MRRLLEARKDEIACAISAEHGKTHIDALGEVARGQEVVEFACGIPHLLKGSFSRNVSGGVDCYDERQALVSPPQGTPIPTSCVRARSKWPGSFTPWAMCIRTN